MPQISASAELATCSRLSPPKMNCTPAAAVEVTGLRHAPGTVAGTWRRTEDGAGAVGVRGAGDQLAVAEQPLVGASQAGKRLPAALWKSK